MPREGIEVSLRRPTRKRRTLSRRHTRHTQTVGMPNEKKRLQTQKPNVETWKEYKLSETGTLLQVQLPLAPKRRN